jgi:hypothetical protein
MTGERFQARVDSYNENHLGMFITGAYKLHSKKTILALKPKQTSSNRNLLTFEFWHILLSVPIMHRM